MTKSLPKPRLECLRLGAEDYIRKPFVSKVMKSRIDHVINTHSATNSCIDLARRDALTGLYNRKYTEELIRKSIETGTSGMMFMIDLDNFKLINDKMGHAEGDKVIRMFADILRQYTEATISSAVSAVTNSFFILSVSSGA